MGRWRAALCPASSVGSALILAQQKIDLVAAFGFIRNLHRLCLGIAFLTDLDRDLAGVDLLADVLDRRANVGAAIMARLVVLEREGEAQILNRDRDLRVVDVVTFGVLDMAEID